MLTDSVADLLDLGLNDLEVANSRFHVDCSAASGIDLLHRFLFDAFFEVDETSGSATDLIEVQRDAR